MREVKNDKEREHTCYKFQFKHTAVTITNHPNIQSIDVAEELSIPPINAVLMAPRNAAGKLKNNDQEAR